MKSHVRLLKGEPILIDRAAHTFGTFREAFSIRSRIRGNGTLTLTEDLLTFDEEQSGTHIEVPLDDIQKLGLGRWHRGKAEFVPVLKVTYSRNLVFGVHVAHPERWVLAIEEIAAGRGHATEVDHARLPHLGFRPSRMLVILFVVVLVLSVGLPLLFSWMQGQTTRNQGSAPPHTEAISKGASG